MSHTFLIDVREINLETYCFQDLRFDSRIVRRARKTRKFSEFWCKGRALNCRKACFRFWIDVLRSSLNQGFFFFFDFVEVLGIVFVAIWGRLVVKWSIGSSACSIILFISVSQRALKDGQSAIVSCHLVIGSSSCDAMLLRNIGKWSLPQRSSCTFHS